MLKIEYKELMKSIEYVNRYPEEGDFGEPRVTIICGENGMIELSEEAMEYMNYPAYIGIDFCTPCLMVTTDVKDTHPIKVTQVGSKGIIQKPELVLEIAQELNLDTQEGMSHQMCISVYSSPNYVFLIVVDPRKALEDVPVVDFFSLKDSNQGKEMKTNEMLTIDNALGQIRMSSEAYLALSKPSNLEFGIYKGYLVAITDQGYGVDVQLIGDEAVIQCKCLTDSITCKYGQENRDGSTFRMVMVKRRKFRKEFYAFFALAREVSPLEP